MSALLYNNVTLLERVTFAYRLIDSLHEPVGTSISGIKFNKLIYLTTPQAMQLQEVFRSSSPCSRHCLHLLLWMKTPCFWVGMF